VSPHKAVKMARIEPAPRVRPVMLAIAGDSAAGKTTLTRGIAAALGADRTSVICVDDYHRYDREERKHVPFTVLNPDCNYLEIMEQHLQLLAMGRPVLKPVYDHSDGRLVRPVLVEPREFVLVEGLLPLHTKLLRACFDITVYLDRPRRSGGRGSCSATVPSVAIPASRSSTSSPDGSRSRSPSSGRSGSVPTSASGSLRSRAGRRNAVRRCPRSCCSGPRLPTPTCPSR